MKNMIILTGCLQEKPLCILKDGSDQDCILQVRTCEVCDQNGTRKEESGKIYSIKVNSTVKYLLHTYAHQGMPVFVTGYENSPRSLIDARVFPA